MSPENVTKATVYFTMVDHPTRGRFCVGHAYATRACALSWVPFVRASYRDLFKVTVSSFTYTLVDGKMDARSLAILDKKFNMDPPEKR